MKGRRRKTEGERVGPDQGSQDLEFCPDKGMGRLPLFKTDICSEAGLRRLLLSPPTLLQAQTRPALQETQPRSYSERAGG